MMTRCTLYKKLEIVPGTYDDYKKLSHYHYRDNGPGQFTTIYALRTFSPRHCLGLTVAVKATDKQRNTRTSHSCIGVIVYSTPCLGQELRNIATGNFFIGFDRNTQLALLNKNVRRISRVIIEPRFRCLGLATRLVRETMPLMNFPIIEASAVMGNINPFFEKAGMKAYHAPEKKQNIRLKEALSAIGIEENMYIDPAAVQRKIETLDGGQVEFFEHEIRRFLQSYSDRRYSRPSLKRTAFVLNKLTARPVYYIWFNPFYFFNEET